MVKSKARYHIEQYIKHKPRKWDTSYWALADSSGYTVDFNLYAGKGSEGSHSKNGQMYDAVKNLIKPFTHQGYQLFVDNFYTSIPLFDDLLKEGSCCYWRIEDITERYP